MPEAFAVEFPGRPVAKAVRVDADDDLGGAIAALGLEQRPTLVVVGGAEGLAGRESDEAGALFEGTVAPVVEELGAQVVDGGTDSGVMQLLGRARRELGLGFPLIGVAARGNVAVPGEPAGPDAVPLEPNHSHFLLVEGDGWGRESPWIARLAGELADHGRSATLLVHGGDISWDDAAESVARGRTVVAVAGSGGAADAVAAGSDPRAERLASSGRVVAADPSSLEPLLRQLLGGVA